MSMSLSFSAMTLTAGHAETLRDIALDVMIEYDPIVELHILSESTFTRYQQERNPFIRNVVTEDRSSA